MKIIGQLRAIAKKTYNIFGLPLTLLLSLIIVIVIFLGIAIQSPHYCQGGIHLPILDGAPNTPITPPPAPPWYQNISISSISGQFITIVFLVTFIVSLVYFVVGIVSYFISRYGQKDTNKQSLARRMIIRGLLGMVLVYLLYVVFNLGLGLFGICL